MNSEQIKNWIKEAHENAVEKGFYDCPECNNGHISIQFSTGLNGICDNCNGSGINPNKNIGELLMLIVSELGEALEAHRCGKFCNESDILQYEHVLDKNKKNFYQHRIKGTFEEEIADVFIRLFDLCGYYSLKLEIEDIQNEAYYSDNVAEQLLIITECITAARIQDEILNRSETISESLSVIIKACEVWNIDIEKHITAKMQFNKTRMHKHGKRY